MLGYLKPHPQPLPRREGSDVMGYSILLFNELFITLLKTPPSNHTAPLPTGEGLGVGLCGASII